MALSAVGRGAIADCDRVEWESDQFSDSVGQFKNPRQVPCRADFTSELYDFARYVSLERHLDISTGGVKDYPAKRRLILLEGLGARSRLDYPIRTNQCMGIRRRDLAI